MGSSKHVASSGGGGDGGGDGGGNGGGDGSDGGGGDGRVGHSAALSLMTHAPPLTRHADHRPETRLTIARVAQFARETCEHPESVCLMGLSEHAPKRGCVSIVV